MKKALIVGLILTNVATLYLLNKKDGVFENDKVKITYKEPFSDDKEYYTLTVQTKKDGYNLDVLDDDNNYIGDATNERVTIFNWID